MSKQTFLFGYFIASIAAGIGFAVWRTILMVRYYDPYMNEYALEAHPSLQVFGYVLFFALLFIATASFFFIRIRPLEAMYEFTEFSAANHQSTTFTSSLLGFLFLAIFVFLCLSLQTMLLPTAYGIFRYAQLAAFVLIFFAAAYFLVNAAGSQRFANAKKVLAFAPPLWGIIFLIASYTNPDYLFKDFNHTLCNISLCALTFFFLYEAKSSIFGKPNGAYVIFALLSIVSSMAYIVPNFVLLAYWELSSELNFIFEAAELGAVVYTAAVAFHLIRSYKPVELELSEEEESFLQEILDTTD